MPSICANGGTSQTQETSARVDILEEQIGKIMVELAAAREASDVAASLTRTCLDEILAVKSLVREQEQRRIRECDLRHENVDRRIMRREQRERTADTTPPTARGAGGRDVSDLDYNFEENSAVTYSREALERAYEQRKHEARVAQEAEAIARSRSRAAMWGALAAVLTAIASAVVAALQGCGG